MGDFSLLDVHWKYNTADRKQSRSSCSNIPGVIQAREMEAQQIRPYHSNNYLKEGYSQLSLLLSNK